MSDPAVLIPNARLLAPAHTASATALAVFHSNCRAAVADRSGPVRRVPLAVGEACPWPTTLAGARVLWRGLQRGIARRDRGRGGGRARAPRGPPRPSGLAAVDGGVRATPAAAEIARVSTSPFGGSARGTPRPGSETPPKPAAVCSREQRDNGCWAANEAPLWDRQPPRARPRRGSARRLAPRRLVADAVLGEDERPLVFRGAAARPGERRWRLSAAGGRRTKKGAKSLRLRSAGPRGGSGTVCVGPVRPRPAPAVVSPQNSPSPGPIRATVPGVPRDVGDLAGADREKGEDDDQPVRFRCSRRVR